MKVESKDTVIVNGIPQNLVTVKTVDTLILNKYSISVTEKPLESSIINLVESDDVFYGNKFNNWEYAIRIKHGENLLLDTVINKNHFKDSLNTEFYNHSLLSNYHLVDYDNDVIEFNGSIAVPDTDWSLDFRNLFHIKTKKMEYKLIVEDDFE